MATPSDDDLDYLREATNASGRLDRFINILEERLSLIDPEYAISLRGELETLNEERGDNG